MTHEEIEKMLAEITPGEWRVEMGGGHKAPSIRSTESVHNSGREFIFKDKTRMSSISYSNEICEIHADLSLPGPKANANLIVNAAPIVRQLLDEVKELKAKANLGTELDIYMARIQKAKETPPKKRTKKQRELLQFAYGGKNIKGVFDEADRKAD